MIVSPLTGQQKRWVGSRKFLGTTANVLTSRVSSLFEFNTNTCLWSVVYAYGQASDSYIVGVSNSGTSRGYVLGTFNGDLRFVKEGVANVDGTATTTLANNRWYAIQGQGTTGGNVKLKRYAYESGILATETVTNTNTLNAPLGDACMVGNKPGGGTLLEWDGLIAEVVILQGDPTNNEFLQWAIDGWISPRLNLKLHSILGWGNPDRYQSGFRHDLRPSAT